MSFDDINKVFIISAGRTGTNFLGDYLQNVIPSSITVHEPDTIVWRKSELIQKVQRQGLWNIFFKRAIGQRGSKALSLKRSRNAINSKDALSWIVKDRSWVKDVDYYIEANTHLFGVTEELLKLPNSKIIFMTRDPRSWIRSGMNKPGWFDKKDFQERINKGGLRRLTPSNVGVDIPEWNAYDAFDKLNWTWSFQNQLFLDCYEQFKSQCLWIRFEDLFIHHDVQLFADLYEFITGNKHGDKLADGFYDMLKKNKVNQTQEAVFPSWQHWDAELVAKVHNRSGALMQQMGYGTEETWLAHAQTNESN